ncbi:MAG: ApaLI family restriction endonuclease [Planctomycetota bacterium]
MINRPDTILIGSSGRNSGKTEYACRVVSDLAKSGTVIAVKVTTVRESGGCPRGGSGCGVCGKLQAPYCLEEETQPDVRNDPVGAVREPSLRLTQPDARKDTQRLLAAGATTVFWLRVHKQHLEAGLEALFAQIPSGTPIVIESNSARLALEPGLFLIIRDAGAAECKVSCAEVMPLADAILDTDGRNWSLDPERLNYNDGRWRVRWPAGAIILAGGASRRMGCNKALLPFGGAPLIQRLAEDLRLRFDTVLIGANDPSKYSFLGLPVLADETPHLGPLEGMRVCLAASTHEWNFVTACDVPCISPHFLFRLFTPRNDVDVVLPVSRNGREPLLALYRRDAYRAATEALAANQRRIEAMLSRLRVREIQMEDDAWYHNLNTPANYEQALETVTKSDTTIQPTRPPYEVSSLMTREFGCGEKDTIMAIKDEIKTLAAKYASELKAKIDLRVLEMKADDTSHYLIYRVLGVADQEGELIDIYQNKGRFLYKYAGAFLEEATKLCFKQKFLDSSSLRIPNTEGRKPKTFEIDCVVGNVAMEIKWKDATTDGDHITKEHARLKAVKNAGYQPIRVMFYYPNRDQAIRIQKTLQTLYEGLGGKYYFADTAWEYIKTATGVNLKVILEELAEENSKANEN